MAGIAGGGTDVTAPERRGAGRRGRPSVERAGVRDQRAVVAAVVVALGFPLVLFVFGVTSLVEIAMDVGGGVVTAMIVLLIDTRGVGG
jgi:hypothetical protein